MTLHVYLCYLKGADLANYKEKVATAQIFFSFWMLYCINKVDLHFRRIIDFN